MAQEDATPAKAEKSRIHNPLGIGFDLARHLILKVPAVPA
jgi:hypothetical protein